MLTSNERALEGQLMADPRIVKAKVEGKSLTQIVQETVKDQIAQIRKSGKLTWAKGSLGEARDPKFVVGKLRKDKTWIGPIGRGKYYVQNMRVFLSNGTEIKSMASIDTKPVIEMVQQRGGAYLEMKFPSDMERVKEALEIYARQAVLLDPHICGYCFQYSEADRKKMTAHIFKSHPKEFNAEMAESTSGMEDEDVAPPAEPEASSVAAE
jgi:hypothetical protein